jgi:hypothetical protein
MSQNLAIGHFYKLHHSNIINNKILIHPFLYLGSNKGRGLFIQFSSVNYDENDENIGSYFSQNDSFDLNIIDGDIYDGLEHHSQADLKSLYGFKLKELEIEEEYYMDECSDDLYEEILKKLNKLEFKDN